MTGANRTARPEALRVIGPGPGATAAPSLAAAFQALTRAKTPRAASALNAIQRIAGAVSTTPFAIIVQHAITANLPRHSIQLLVTAAACQVAAIAASRLRSALAGAGSLGQHRNKLAVRLAACMLPWSRA